jgi:hypothetical protein
VTVSGDFLHWVCFYKKKKKPGADSRVKTFLNAASNLQRYSTLESPIFVHAVSLTN